MREERGITSSTTACSSPGRVRLRSNAPYEVADMVDKTLEFCCSQMASHIETGDLHIHFYPKFREFGIGYADDGLSIQIINYCPWCGSALPSSLRNDWFDELDSLGIDPDGDVPSAYLTDAWWQKKLSS